MFDQINNPGIGAKKAWGERISEAAIIVAVVTAVLGGLLYFALL
jgi:sulfur carrier protein ThiS